MSVVTNYISVSYGDGLMVHFGVLALIDTSSGGPL
jgi:hypothetical protein